MTPKEKAIELVGKFNNHTVKELIYFKNGKVIEGKTEAKQCALIAVDEILNSNPNYPEFKENEGTPIRYWEVVKQEIENL
jgi:hypothetical protein